MYKSVKQYSDNELINIALDFADDNSEFNPHYIHQMEEIIDEYDELTDGQRLGLENIVEKWNMI